MKKLIKFVYVNQLYWNMRAHGLGEYSKERAISSVTYQLQIILIPLLVFVFYLILEPLLTKSTLLVWISVGLGGACAFLGGRLIVARFKNQFEEWNTAIHDFSKRRHTVNNFLVVFGGYILYMINAIIFINYILAS